MRSLRIVERIGKVVLAIRMFAHTLASVAAGPLDQRRAVSPAPHHLCGNPLRIDRSARNIGKFWIIYLQFGDLVFGKLPESLDVLGEFSDHEVSAVAAEIADRPGPVPELREPGRRFRRHWQAVGEIGIDSDHWRWRIVILVVAVAEDE